MVRRRKSRIRAKDRLSDLPDGVQRRILSLLPMKDAGKLGTLSRLWRMIWYSTPKLYFNYNEFPGGENKIERFRRFVDQTLALHDESDVDTFMLYFYIHELENGIAINNEWIEFAIGHNVNKLSLYGRFDGLTNFPASFFVCKSLVELDISLAKLRFILPPNAALPNLKTLSLRIVIITEQSFVGDICLSCPMLEDLCLSRCDLTNIKVLLISASKLKILTMEGCLGIHNCVVNLQTPSLSSLYILSGIARDYILNIPTGTFLHACANCETLDFTITSNVEELFQLLIKLMQGISMAKHLWFNQGTIEVLAHTRALWDLHNSISFSNMKKLELDLWPTLHQVQMAILILRRCQNLVDLDIFMQRPEREDSQMRNMDLNLENISFVLNNLHHVLINNFKAEENEMVLVKFLLSNSPKLVCRKIVKKSLQGITSEITLISNREEEYEIATSGDKVLLSLTDI